MKKTLLSILLVFCLLIIVAPAMDVEADAATTYTSGDWTYSVTDGIATITGYSGSASVVDIPAYIGEYGYPVQVIGANAFSNNAAMKQVTIPAAVTKIDHYAFSGCINLTSVTLPESLGTLGEKAFMNCARLERITVNSNKISDIKIDSFIDGKYRYGQPFYGAGTLTDGISVVFAEGCTRVPMNLFYAYNGSSYAPNIKSVWLADSVVEVGENAVRNVPSVKKFTMGDGLMTVGKHAFMDCTKLYNVIWSDALTTIGEGAFENCVNITSIDFPDNVTTINSYAFSGCAGLTSMELPASVSKINHFAFNGCVNLTSITLPKKLETLGEKVFQNCTKVEKIVINSANLSDIKIDSYIDGAYRYGQPFYGVGSATDGVTVTFGTTCNYIPARLFYAYSGYTTAPKITKVVVKSGAETIRYDAFRGCQSIKSVTLPSTLTSIGTSAFEDCIGITSVVFPSSLELIDSYAFKGCTGIASASFPSGLAKINHYAFSGCTSLKAISLPAQLQTLGERAFENCTAVTKIVLNGSSIADIKIDSYIDGKYRYGQPFCSVGTETSGVTVTISDTCTNIPANLFYAYSGVAYAPNIKSIKIPASVTTIGKGAFRNVETLKSIRFFGDSPTCGTDILTGITATAYYPTNKAGWTEEARAAYGGTVTWKGFYTAEITSEPKTGYAKMGATVKTTVKADGDELKYEWYIKNSGATKYSKSSVTSATYSTTMSSKSKDRLVYCVITDKYGSSVKTKTVALREQVSITSQSKTTYTKQGATAKATVKASGDGLKYQWYIKNAGGTSYSKSSITGTTYSCTMNSTTKDRLVYCVVTDKYGKTARTETVRLRMAATITSQPTAVYAKQGTTAKATVKAVGDGLQYTWYIKNAGQTSYSKSSVTTSTYSVTMNSTTKDRRLYCVITDKYGKSVTSDTMILRMAATITAQPKDASAAKGSVAKTTVKAAGDGLTYTWYIKNAGSSSYSKSSVTTASYSCKMSATTDGRTAYCVVTDKYGKTAKSTTVTFTMK